MDFRAIASVLDVAAQKSQRDLAVLVQQEAAINAKLAEIRSDLSSDRAQLPKHKEHRAIGADLLWTRWANKALRDLNIELAQIRARKEPIVSAHKKALGKIEVAKALAQDQELQKKRVREKRALSNVLELVAQGVIDAHNV